MKRCDFCAHCGRTEKDEQVCTKRLLYVGDLEGDFLCEDFTILLDLKAALIILGISAMVLITLLLAL